MLSTVALLSLVAAVSAQQVGTNTAEVHPPLTWETCAAGGACTTNNGQIVLDANWRWLHNVGGSTNCYTGNTWDATLCPDATTCAKNCALDGADYSGTYGITTPSANTLRLNFVTTGSNTNVGSRSYLMDSATTYHLFHPLNQEFTMDVNLANLPCGLNGAVYFAEMSADGGKAAYATNAAGAEYGTGYCDSQCPRDLKFIDGLANVVGWTPDSNSVNSGTGLTGSCCNEMDIWEANSISEAYTPHPCSVVGQTACTGAACGYPSRYSGVCDPDGCDFNSYRMGDLNFYGPGMTIDTTKTITVVTQFITSDGTNTGTLTEIKRLYVQGGVVYDNSAVNVPGIDPSFNSITEAYCQQQKTVFNNTNSFDNHGGLATMGQAFAKGVVLVLSIWDDYAVDMLWLDSLYPTTATPGVGNSRGTCPTTSGVPATVEANSPNAYVTYGNIKFGPIGSTFSGTPINPPPSSSTATSAKTTATTAKTTAKTTATTAKTTTTPHTTTSTASGATQTEYGQCGGTGYTGPTACVSGTTCVYSNAYYSQCLP